MKGGLKYFGILFLVGMASVLAHAETADEYYNRLTTERVVSEKSIIWEQVGPGNAGFANLLRYHPTLPGIVATCPDMWNAYQSEDNGNSWYGITDYDGKGDFMHLRDLYYSPKDVEFGLAISQSRLFETADTGRTWQTVAYCPWYAPDANGDDNEGWKKKVSALAIDPNNSDIWFVGGGSFVRGQEWLSCYQNISAASPHGDEAGLLGTMWRTTDAGQTWTDVKSGLNAKAQVGRIIVNPKNSTQVFAATNYGLYRSDNSGTSWTQISAGKLESDIIMDMDAYYDASTGKFTLYLIDQVQYNASGQTTTCSGGIFRSDDNGDTWVKMNGDLGLDIDRLKGNVPNNYYKYIAVWMGITESVAKSTYPTLPNEAVQFFNMISVDPSREGAVYVGLPDPQVANSIVPGRLWATSNNGEKWINTARLYEEVWKNDSRYWSERGNPFTENMEVGHSSPHMQSGSDYALRSMRALDVGVDGSVMIISDHSTMLSTDHGESWKQVDEDYTPDGNIIGRGNSNLPALTIGQDKRSDHMVLGSGEHRVWIPTDDSPDNRQALKYIADAQETVISLAFDPYDVDLVYGTSSRQANKQYIFNSTNGGHNWVKWGVATPASNAWLDDFYTNALTIDPIDNNYMYHGITRIVDVNKGTQGGFFVSSDNGKTFQQSNNGLPSPARISDIKFDPRDDSRKSLFAAAQNYEFTYEPPQAQGGLYHSSDRGANWTSVNLPSSVKGVNKMIIDHTNRMYITTGYRGSEGGVGLWCTDDFGQTWQQVFKYEGTTCVDVSPFDHNFLVVTVDYLEINPGVYVSRDRGQTWHKSNTGIVTPHKILDIKFSINNPSEIWIANLGTGFYKGEIKDDGPLQVIDLNQNSTKGKEGGNTQLSAEIIEAAYSSSKMVWKSDNPSIATVDQNGLVSFVGMGKTKIWVTTEDGRFSDYCVVVSYDKNSAISENTAQSNLSVVPSVVTSSFSVKGIQGDSTIKVFDISGNKVLNTTESQNIDISHFLSGTYLVCVNTAGVVQVLKLLKV